MKKHLTHLKLTTTSFLMLIAGVLVAQNDSGQKEGFQKPSKLIILKKSQGYTLQNTSVLFKDVLDPSPQTSFLLYKTDQDQLGNTHQKLQQYYNGVKVEFGTLVVHGKSNTVESLSSEYYPIQEFDVTPGINNAQAFSKAVNHIGAQKYMWEFQDAAMEMDNYQKPSGELVILPDFDSGRDVNDVRSYKLAYKFDMFATNPMSRGNLYIDATNGQALFYDAIIKHAASFGYIGETRVEVETHSDYCARIESEEAIALASGTAATRYSGNRTIETRLSGGNYILEDTGRGIYTRDALNQGAGNGYPYVSNYSQFTDNDNNWTSAEHNNASKDNAAQDAHWGAMMTYDYWQTEHGRDSYNGSGAQIRSYVHVDNNYDNAFWNGSVMSYGDGSSNGNEGNGFFDALTSIDVAAHEIGHAVTSFTANLAYQRESGGLNEGFSDIWGAAVEHFAKGNGSDTNPAATIWLIGDEIDRRNGSAALRSMSNPTSLGQPDTYGGAYWQNPNCGTPTQANDYCGVHTNSGVLNYWYYLTAVGGSGTNDIGNPFNVNGVGMVKSSAIAYRTLNVYLSANSTHADARAGAIQSAKDLYGAGGAEEQAVTNAWHAVGVGAAYGAPSNYCASASTNVNDEYISRVQLGSIDNTSGAQFYSNFTSQSTDLNEGQAYTITVTPTWPGTVYAEGYAVWIDYNGDQDFDDADELVWSKSASTNTPSSGSFTVPSGTAGAATRMRVSMMYNGIPTACESFTYGEVEDYTVNLSGAAGDTQAPSNPTGLVASNITETTVDLAWNASSDNVGVTGYNVYQGSANLGTVTSTSAQITGLTESTAYTFNVTAIDAAGNVSSASNIINITTLAPPDTQAPSNPASLVVSNTTETSVDLSWNASTDNIGVTGYNVYQGTTNLGTITGTSSQITNLTAATTYSFSVRAIDAAGNISGASNIANATTSGGGSCTGGITSFPYSESYEIGLGGWTQSIADDINWTRDSNGTPSNGTGPSNGASGSFYMFVEASGNNTGYPNKRAILNSPCLDLRSETVAFATFNYHMYGAADMGSISLQASDDNGDTWTTVWTLTGNQGNSWLEETVDLSSYTGASVQLRFNRLTGSTWKADIAVDNFRVTNSVNTDPCAGVLPYNGGTTYVPGDRVTYNGSLYERTTSGWTNLGPCGTQGVNNFAPNTLGNDGPPLNNALTIYPNPTASSLQITLPGIEAHSYVVYTLTGRAVLKGAFTQTLDVSQLSSGVYMLQIEAGEQLFIERFIKE